MIWAALYVIASAAFFIWVQLSPKFKRLPRKLHCDHPEMKEVRRTEPLLAVHFEETKPEQEP